MIHGKLKEKLEAAATGVGCEDALELLTAHAGECAYFFNADGKPSGSDVGASRIGGSPDLADSTAWPSTADRGRSLDGEAIFVAQFNLAEVPPIGSLPLPRTGLLLLFLREWGSNPVQLSGVYERDLAVVKTRSRSLPTRLEDAPTAFRATPIRFEPGVSLPVSDRLFQKAWAELAPNIAVEDLVETLLGEAEGQIGGYSRQADHRTLRSTVFEQMGWSEYLKADEYESLTEYEDELARLQSRRLEELRPKVQWIESHRSAIEAEVGKWTLLCSLAENMRADFHVGSALALDVFVRSADLSMDLSRLVGQAPQ